MNPSAPSFLDLLRSRPVLAVPAPRSQDMRIKCMFIVQRCADAVADRLLGILRHQQQKLAFGSDNQVLVERISMVVISTHLPPPGDHGKDRTSGRNHGCRLLSYTLKVVGFLKMKVKNCLGIS